MARNAVDRIEDPLPEHAVYEDRGCGNGCVRSLECPFERCRFDDPLLWQRMERDQRDQRIVTARAQDGLTVEALAARFGVSRRTVHRALSRARPHDKEPAH